MNIIDELKRRLRLAGLDPEMVMRDPRAASGLKVLDRIDLLFRTQGFAAKLLENLGRRAPIPRGRKHEYFRQCLARGNEQSFSILLMVQAGSHYDASILNRTLVERAILLPYLVRHNQFDVFADWSYLKSYEHRQKYVRLMGGKGLITAEERSRYEQLRATPEIRDWRFNARTAAKEAGLDSLYETIYDFASNHVHPRYGEGYDALGYEDDDDDRSEWRRLLIHWAAQSLGLIVGTVFAYSGKGVHPVAGDALVCLGKWVAGSKPEDASARFDALFALPSEAIIAY